MTQDNESGTSVFIAAREAYGNFTIQYPDGMDGAESSDVHAKQEPLEEALAKVVDIPRRRKEQGLPISDRELLAVLKAAQVRFGFFELFEIWSRNAAPPAVMSFYNNTLVMRAAEFNLIVESL